MLFNRLFSLVFSMAAITLVGCGGGSANPAPATPGNCASGSVYSAQYGCLAQTGCPTGMGRTSQGACVNAGNTVLSSCQQTNQGPMVHTAQYGCIPQGNCPVGQGSYVVNGTVSCIPAQVGGTMTGMATGCPMISTNPPIYQVMTSKGCLPQQYPCPAGTGFLQGRCYPGAGAVSPEMSDESIDSEDDSQTRVLTVRVRHVKVRRNCR